MKKWYKSKMIRLGITELVIAMVDYFANGQIDEENIVLAVSGLLVIMLRLMTETGIDMGEKKSE